MNQKIELSSNNDSLTDQQFWEKSWESSNISLINLQNLVYRQKELIRYLKQLRFHQTRRILEVGVGPGIKLFELARSLDLEPWGLDFSSSACQLAQKNAAVNKVDAVIVRGDIFLPPFFPGTFEIVLSQGVIEHFASPLKILTKCSELVAPGGYLITTVPNIAGFYGTMQKIIDEDNFNKHIAIRLIDLRSMYEKLGLEVIVSGTLGGFYIPYYPREKSFINWVFWAFLRKSLLPLLRRFKFELEYFSAELLIIGRKPGSEPSSHG